MGKNMFFVLLALMMSAAVFAAESGGSARLASLGNPELMVVDSNTGIDLYGEGFISGIFARPKESVLSFYPSLDFRYYKQTPSDPSDTVLESNSVGAGDAYYSTPRDSGLVFYPSNDLAVLFRPYAYYNGGIMNETTPGPSDKYQTSGYLYAGELAAALKLNPGLAVSLLAGYVRDGLTRRDAADTVPMDIALYKLEYEGSVAFLPAQEGGLTFALTAGNKTTTDLLKDFRADQPDLQELNFEIGELNGNNLWLYQIDTQNAATITITAQDIHFDVIHVNFGVSDVKTDGTGFSAMAGLKGSPDLTTTDYSYYRDKASGKETKVNNGTRTGINSAYGAQGSFDLRCNAGPFLTGAKLDLSWQHLHDVNSSDEMNVYNIKAVTGLNLTAVKGMQVPLELYYESFVVYTSDNSFTKIYDLGASLGDEFEISKGMAIRLGADYGLTGALLEDGAPGTKNNPFRTTLGLNAGVGFNTGGAQTNIALRFESLGLAPMVDSISSLTDRGFKLLADVKFVL